MVETIEPIELLEPSAKTSETLSEQLPSDPSVVTLLKALRCAAPLWHGT